MGLLKDLSSYKTLNEEEQERVKRQVRDLGMMTLGGCAVLCGAILGSKLADKNIMKQKMRRTSGDLRVYSDEMSDVLVDAISYNPNDMKDVEYFMTLRFASTERAINFFNEIIDDVKAIEKKCGSDMFNKALEATLEDK